MKPLLLFTIPFLACAHLASGQAKALAPPCAPDGSGETPPGRFSSDTLNESSRPATLVGRVVSERGVPLAQSVLALQRSFYYQEGERGTRADKDGLFRLDSVPPARYILVIRAIGYASQWHELELRAAATDSICIHLRANPGVYDFVAPAGAHTPSKPSNER